MAHVNLTTTIDLWGWSLLLTLDGSESRELIAHTLLTEGKKT
jgi:hypothetical protein